MFHPFCLLNSSIGIWHSSRKYLRTRQRCCRGIDKKGWCGMCTSTSKRCWALCPKKTPKPIVGQPHNSPMVTWTTSRKGRGIDSVSWQGTEQQNRLPPNLSSFRPFVDRGERLKGRLLGVIHRPMADLLPQPSRDLLLTTRRCPTFETWI